MQNLFPSNKTKLVLLIALILTALMLAACGSALGAILSEQKAIDTFVAARDGGIDASTVKVNGMTKCDVSDESKVQFNIDNAWLVNYDYMSPLTNSVQNIALAVGEKDGSLSIVAQGMCP